MAAILPGWLSMALCMYLVFLVVEPFTVPSSMLALDLVLRVGSTLGAVLAMLLLRRKGVPAGKAHRTACVLGLYVLTVTTLDYLFLQDPFFDFYIQLLLIASGMVLLRADYQLFISVSGLAAWLFAHLATGGALTVEKTLLTFVSLVIGYQSLTIRRRIALDQWERRSQEDETQERLREALQQARKAKELLDIEVAQASSQVSQALDEIIVNREQRARIHRHILHSNRLSAMGRLAGGLAHRLNNRLLVVLGTVDCLADELPAPDDQAALQEIRQAAERGAKLTSQLIPLTGRQHLSPEVVTVNELLEQFQTLLSKTASPLKIENRAGFGSFEVDREAWYQVFSNLIRNADQANAEGQPILFRIVEEDSQLVFSVEDKGPGIPKKFRERIFEPFFTTRGDRGGTGLGLSIVLGLVEQMGGQLTVTSARDGGARFSVAFESAHDTNPNPITSKPRVRKELFQGERVLVVEDDPRVLKVLKRHLQEIGLRVSTARNGVEGLERYSQEPVGLVITDVVMPAMDGPTLVKKLWQRDPDLKVLFTSGYSDARLSHQGIDPETFSFLAKPYTRETLAQSLQAVMLKENSTTN